MSYSSSNTQTLSPLVVGLIIIVLILFDLTSDTSGVCLRITFSLSSVPNLDVNYLKSPKARARRCCVLRIREVQTFAVLVVEGHHGILLQISKLRSLVGENEDCEPRVGPMASRSMSMNGCTKHGR